MKTWHKILLAVQAPFLIALCMAYAAPYINPDNWWLPAFFGLGYFAILLINLMFCIVWLFFYRRIFFLELIVLIAGWNTHTHFFALHTGHHPENQDTANTFRILTYNVKGFDAYDIHGKYLKRGEIIDNIAAQKPDIVCLQEFNTYQNHPVEPSNLNMVIRASGLDNYYYYKAYENKKATRSFGLIILSRYPVIDTGLISYESKSKLNSAIYIDVKLHNDTVRIFNCHLQSTQLSHYDFEFIEASDSTHTNFDSKRVKNKLKESYEIRARECLVIRDRIQASPYPVIVCGDFNDTPVSYSYRQISGGLQDAFLETGRGIGATYVPFPCMRIDYQLFDPGKFEILDCQKIREKSSDHYPLITTFALSH